MRGDGQGSGAPPCAALVLLALALSAVAATPAAAAPSEHAAHGGTRWPGKTITYVNRAGPWSWSVGQAVAAWNASRIGVRLVPTASARRAQVRISAYDFRPLAGRGTIAGQATVGYLGGRRAFVRLASPGSAPWADRFVMARVAAHELGHVLGLGHSAAGCSIMIPALTGSRWGACPEHRASEWRCRLVERDDARRAARIYGGKPRSPRHPATCFRHPPPAAPTELSPEVAVTESLGGEAPVWSVQGRLAWRNPTSRSFGGVKVSVRLGACPATPADPAARTLFEGADDSLSRRDLRWSRERGRPASAEIAFEAVEPGRYCVAAWASDEGPVRFSRTPATTWIDVGAGAR